MNKKEAIVVGGFLTLGDVDLQVPNPKALLGFSLKCPILTP